MLVNPKQEDSAQVAANETVDDTEAQQTIMIIQGQDGNYEEKDGFLVQSGQVSFTPYRSPWTMYQLCIKIGGKVWKVFNYNDPQA